MFFNIQKGFIIQSGDPTNTGKGGQSIYEIIEKKNPKKYKYFPDEIHKDVIHNKKGLL